MPLHIVGNDDIWLLSLSLRLLLGIDNTGCFIVVNVTMSIANIKILG